MARAADGGDAPAQRIWLRAGVYLAEALHAAAQGLPLEFSWGGRLFEAGPLLLDPFRAELARRMPGARLSQPQGQAVDGALMLARRSPASSAGPAGRRGSGPVRVRVPRRRAAWS